MTGDGAELSCIYKMHKTPIWCLRHFFDLIEEEFFNAIPNLKELLKNMKKLVSKFKNSMSLKVLFKSTQKKINDEFLQKGKNTLPSLSHLLKKKKILV